jgi:hypothetical protein
LRKFTDPKLLRKFLVLDENLRSITLFRRAWHWPKPKPHFFNIHFNNILKYKKISFKFSTKLPYTYLICHMHATHSYLIRPSKFVTLILFGKEET